MDAKTVKIGLVGFGTVGSGVAKILQENGQEIAERTGIRLELACVADKDITTPRVVSLPAGVLTDDVSQLLNDKSIDIAIELVGGTTFAKDLVLTMLAAGKHVVTANKALLSEQGAELYRAALKARRCIAFEASCCGGIPIVSALRTGLAANQISALYGIFNGTCNYILTNMTRSGTAFADVLKAAQDKGFAEADPTLDIDGTDTAHKLALLAGLAFGCRIEMKDIHIDGIQDVQIDDIRNGQEMGYVLKLLAIGEKDAAGQLSLRVHPSFVSEETPLADVDGPFNAVSVFGNAVGNVMFYGRGAGMMATASAVVADIIDIALGTSERLFERMPMVTEKRKAANFKKIDDIVSRFYLRIMAKDEPGVFAKYGQVLGKHGISISGAMQHEGSGPDSTVPVVITTHPTRQKNMAAALNELQRLDIVRGKPVCIRIVEIPEDKE
ncbi:MAG: homoserine dehydrogenase [Phycisphaerae bacterium]|nr:homoserine dehydrogenase [Phycisphaerae bacterium]